MPLKTHVAAPGLTNSERLTARPARREGLVIIYACTEPIGAGIVVPCALNAFDLSGRLRC